MFDYLNQWKWYTRKSEGTFYAQRNKGRFPLGKIIIMHRVVMNEPNEMEIDHWDGDGLNNTRENLRVCTHAENSRNRVKQTNNTSGYKGVPRKTGKKFRAFVGVNGKKIYLECFESSYEAAIAYDKAAKKYHGKFAKTNF